MSWFQLDPNSIAERTRARAPDLHLPSLAESVGRGMLGFTAVSVAGFAPWALAGGWFHRNTGEAGMYAVSALVFIILSGLLLHKLIIGPGSLARFYKLFSAAFTVYAGGWIAGWMLLRGHAGSLAGLAAGTAAMGWIFARAFDAREATLKVIALLFVLNAAGYFAGGWVEGGLSTLEEFQALSKAARITTAKLLWGVCYGLGLGAGLGMAFHLCQTRARELLGGGKSGA